MLNKFLNHKSIITAFEEAHNEFSQMSDTDFQSMIRDTELFSLGSLLYETNTVTGYGDVLENYVNIVIEGYRDYRVVHKNYTALMSTNKLFSPASSDNYMSNNEDEIWLKAA